MKKICLALAFSANVVMFPLVAQGKEKSDGLDLRETSASKALMATHNGKLASKGKVDLSNPRQLRKTKSRLNALGINEDNRSYLFSVLDQKTEPKSTTSSAFSVSTSSDVDSDTGIPSDTTLTTSTLTCEDSDDRVCQFFNHTGINIRGSKAEPDTLFLVASALYSEVDSTNYTLVDLALMNENFQYLTSPQAVEYFGEDTTNQKAKAVETYALLNQGLVDAITNSTAVYGDAWVLVVKEDEAGNKITSEHNIMIEYDRLSLLKSISSYMDADVVSTVSAADNAFGISAVVEKPGGISPNDVNLVHPVNTVGENAGLPVEDSPDERIIICLNRNYGDCDYENNYPTSTPVADVLLKIPFEGSIKIAGKVEKVYAPGDELPLAANGLPTNIYVQLREQGGAYTIKNNAYTNPNVSFVEELEANIDYDETENETTLSWNFPRETTSFGDASLFGRYIDAHWIMNIVVDVTLSQARPRPPAPHVYVIGSEDPYSTFVFDRHAMQFVYSCLAKGSQISLPNGINKAIEELKIGEQVLGSSEFSPNKLLPLVIEDISVGVEHIPMIELITSDENKLLLTESHPVFTASGNAVWAKNVKVGDHILVAQGSTKTARVENVREVQYDDNVYNLKLARLEGDEAYDSGESFAMVANGMIVGDLNMQYEVEIQQQEESTEDVLNRIPEVWHADYINSIQ